MSWLLVLVWLVGCGCQEVSSIEIEDNYEKLEAEHEDVIWATVADFVAWTGSSEVCVDKIRIEEPDPYQWEGSYHQFAGEYNGRDIRLGPSVLTDDSNIRWTLLHELTHAWDLQHYIPSQQWGDVLSESYGWEVYPWQHEGGMMMKDEALARVSEYFTPNPLEFLLEPACADTPLYTLLRDEIYLQAPEVPVEVVSLEWEPIFEGRGAVERWSEVGDETPEAVLLWQHVEGTQRSLRQKNMATGEMLSVPTPGGFSLRYAWRAMRGWHAVDNIWLHIFMEEAHAYRVDPKQQKLVPLQLPRKWMWLVETAVAIGEYLYFFEDTTTLYQYHISTGHIKKIDVPEVVQSSVGAGMYLVIYQGKPAFYSEREHRPLWAVYDPERYQWENVEGPLGGESQNNAQQGESLYLQNIFYEGSTETSLYWGSEEEGWTMAQECVPRGYSYKRAGAFVYRVNLDGVSFTVERARLPEEE